MNKIIIKNAYIPSNLEEFVKEFINLLYTSVLDMFSDYNQVELTTESRNFTRF